MEETKYEEQELKPGDMVIRAEASDDYEILPDGEMLKCHIASTSTVDTPPYGDPGGELEKKLVVKFEIDEENGKGQVYTKWIRPSLFPKSNFAKLAVAVFGELPQQVDPAKDLVGLPLRITLVNKDKDGVTRQYIDGYFKPTKDQFESGDLTADEALEILDEKPDLAETFKEAAKATGKKI